MSGRQGKGSNKDGSTSNKIGKGGESGKDGKKNNKKPDGFMQSCSCFCFVV